MRFLALILVLTATTFAQPLPEKPRFVAVDVVADSGKSELGAWQIELDDPSNTAQIVGVEGGESAAFGDPAFYDPAALMQSRIILAAYSTGKNLPKGRTRIATIHLRVEGERPDFTINVIAAGDEDGSRIPLTIQLEERNRS